MMCINSVAATCNVMVITDPTGKDPNGAAAGSMFLQITCSSQHF